MTSNKPSSCITSGSGCSSATNYPQFIDTGYCLCGLVNSRAPNRNGNLVQVWRCIGNANEDVNGTSSDHGKWYYTQLPSEEVSGLGQKQNYNGNPPNTRTAYALAPGNNNTKQYVTQSTNLQGQDPGCTGVNNTQSSAQYYSNSKSNSNGPNAANSGTTSATSGTTRAASTSSTRPSSASNPPASTSSSSSGPSSTASAAITTASSSPTATPTSGNHATSMVPSISLKSLCLLGVLVIPAILGLA